jgi:hypothetical protein
VLADVLGPRRGIWPSRAPTTSLERLGYTEEIERTLAAMGMLSPCWRGPQLPTA